MVSHPAQYRHGMGVNLTPRAVSAYRNNAQIFRSEA
jgi:hypothetical protein